MRPFPTGGQRAIAVPDNWTNCLRRYY